MQGSRWSNSRSLRHQILWWSIAPGNTIPILCGIAAITSWRNSHIITFTGTYTIRIFVSTIYGINKILDEADLLSHYFVWQQKCIYPARKTSPQVATTNPKPAHQSIHIWCRPKLPPFTWDTDGIPFIIDNSATAIISNMRKLFTGPLVPTKVTLETAEGGSTRTKLVGSICLVLTDNSNHNHVYIVPGCVYDPGSPLNILGVPALGTFFEDCADTSDMLASDGTIIKSGATRSHFVWDHGKHERHFIHGISQMPELLLYVGNAYFNAFCTCVHNMLSDKV